jgi:hypothetical protein
MASQDIRMRACSLSNFPVLNFVVSVTFTSLYGNNFVVSLWKSINPTKAHVYPCDVQVGQNWWCCIVPLKNSNSIKKSYRHYTNRYKNER